jgi:hypothetical protein
MNPKVIKIPVPDLPNCFIAISCRLKKINEPLEQLNTQHVLSFITTNEDQTEAVEWEPEYGPISIYSKETGGRSHWLLGPDCKFDWTQLGVDSEGLPAAFIQGNMQHIFSILMRYLPSPQ